MNFFEKLLGALHLNFLNRSKSPSQKNLVKAKNTSIGSLQQAGGDILNVRQEKVEAPMIEISPDSFVSDLARYNVVNIFTTKKSQEPLNILECFFDGVPTNHASERLDERDVFHFDTLKKENIKDGYEPVFSLKVQKHTGEEFLFESKLKIKLFGNRYDLMVPGAGTLKQL